MRAEWHYVGGPRDGETEIAYCGSDDHPLTDGLFDRSARGYYRRTDEDGTTATFTWKEHHR